jgi:hypothetical protein
LISYLGEQTSNNTDDYPDLNSINSSKKIFLLQPGFDQQTPKSKNHQNTNSAMVTSSNETILAILSV